MGRAGAYSSRFLAQVRSELASVQSRRSPAVVAEEFDRFGSSYGEPTVAFERVRAAFREYLPDGSCAAEIARRVQQYVAQGRSASFIRVGDGEGNLMGLALGEYPALEAHCARKAARIHFGMSDVLLKAGSELQKSFRTAVRNADLIGIPDRLALQWAFANREFLGPRPIHGIGAVYTYLYRFADELEVGSKTCCSNTFSRMLLPHYHALIEGNEIGLVSCHADLPEGLRRRMGARNVAFYPVPKQARMIPGRPADTGHYPGRYRALLEELRNARPGVAYFVAAGMLGKIYCEMIRAAGGVAVDIGSTADIWAGVRSRRRIPQETVDTWRVV
jgi:hypothetical protein